MSRIIGYSVMWKEMELVSEYPFNHCGERMWECPECGAHFCVFCMAECDFCGMSIDFTK